jgi:hypothetical protein
MIWILGSNYGFINQRGEFTVVPQFIGASCFVEGLTNSKTNTTLYLEPHWEDETDITMFAD